MKNNNDYLKHPIYTIAIIVFIVTVLLYMASWVGLVQHDYVISFNYFSNFILFSYLWIFVLPERLRQQNDQNNKQK